MENIKLKALSQEGKCIASFDLFNVIALKRLKKAFIDTHKLYVGSNQRVYTKIKLKPESSLYWWMDCITGSLYDTNGIGLTNPNPVKVNAMRQNQTKAAGILMATNNNTGKFDIAL